MCFCELTELPVGKERGTRPASTEEEILLHRVSPAVDIAEVTVRLGSPGPAGAWASAPFVRIAERGQLETPHWASRPAAREAATAGFIKPWPGGCKLLGRLTHLLPVVLMGLRVSFEVNPQS